MDAQKLVQRVQTYFFIAFVLKVLLASASFALKEPFWLGFIIPLVVMVCYWVVGFHVREKWNTQLTLSKFADSVYYLGFLFTVVSIIICLLDIESMGDNLYGMAMRFGAAMCSTALGMLARVMHTGFKVDTNDAVKSVEERAVRSAEELTMAFDASSQQLAVFRDQVMAASKEAVQSVHEQITAIAQHSTNSMDAFFSSVTAQSNQAFERMLSQASEAGEQMLATIGGLSEKSALTLTLMEGHALDFGKKAGERLEHTVFPDNLFTQKLSPAITTLSGATDGLNEDISALALDVKTSARMVGTAIRSLNTKTQTIGDAVVAVGSIVESQDRLMESMKSQSHDVMERVERVQKEYLDSLDDQREEFMADMKANQEVFSQIVQKIDDLRLSVSDNGAVEGFAREVAESLKTISETGMKNVETLADSMQTNLAPLVDAVVASNEVQRMLVSHVELSTQQLGAAQSQMLDELKSAIEQGANPVSLPGVINEVAHFSSGENVVDSTRTSDGVADVRTA